MMSDEMSGKECLKMISLKIIEKETEKTVRR